MPFDAVTVNCISMELNTALSQGRIDKVYMPTYNDVILLIRAHGQNRRLLLSCNPSFPRVHFTATARENPATPPGFCMLLRKHLTNGKIVKIDSPKNERIISFHIECKNELGDITEKQLIIELFGKNSNIILLHETGIVADCVRHIDNSMSRERIVLPGLPYFLPNPQDKISPDDATEETIKKLLSKCDPTKKADTFILDNFLGVSPLICREIVYLWGSDTDLCVGAKSGLVNAIAFYMEKLATCKFSPVTLWDKNGKPMDFSCIEIRQYADNLTVKNVPLLCEALGEFFEEKERKTILKDKTGALLKTVENLYSRIIKKAALQQESILSAKDCEGYKVKGDLIISNIYKIKKGDKNLITENFYSQNLETVNILLDANLTPAENANKFYKRYNKLKNTGIKAKIQYDRSMEEAEYLDSVLNALIQCEDISIIDEIREELEELGYIKSKQKKQNKKAALPSPHQFISSDGFTIYVGKNNKQNDYLTLKLSSSKDIWFHTKGFPGSHTVIAAKGQTVPDTTLNEAACLAAYYSKARGSAQIPVDYCIIKNVKKPSGAKPGMVIYENYNTAYVTPSEEFIKNINKVK
ncbi:MAG: NFACT family protein [Clostridia bacterium]|nr:NFACT family protein [Clostridia bacterium]